MLPALCEVVYTSTVLQNGWDGYYKGQPESAGTYVYTISFIDSDGVPVNLKGTVNIVK